MRHYLRLKLLIGLICILLIFFISNLSSPPLAEHSGNLLTFSYPSSWQLEEWPSNSQNEIVVDKTINPQNFFEFFPHDNTLVKFNYPSKWLINQESFSGSEIVKHIQLVAPDKKNICIVQVWEQYKPLDEFIKDMQNSPISGEPIDNLSISNITVNQQKGHEIFYSHNSILCKEIYFSYNNQIYRIAYFYNGEKWTNEQENNFKMIINSLETKKGEL